MRIEKRRTKRIDVDVTVSLRQLGDSFVSGYSSDTVDVHVIDISKGGIAFESDYDFKINSYYDTIITLANKESFEAVIEVIRKDVHGANNVYGCRFVGINADDQFKIDVYQLLHDNGEAQ